jgi:hypothetical protein
VELVPDHAPASTNAHFRHWIVTEAYHAYFLLVRTRAPVADHICRVEVEAEVGMTLVESKRRDQMWRAAALDTIYCICGTSR